jgi:phosphotriesterase-related protein
VGKAAALSQLRRRQNEKSKAEPREQPMKRVQTVQGPVEAEELGVTLAHEHVLFRDEAVVAQWPGRYDDRLELDAALVAVNAAKDRGVRTIVDATAMFGGRDVRFMKRVAEETGVRIVPCTGIYSYDYLPHYFANRDVDTMADHFVEDIEVGIQGTDIRAAFLKCAADAAGVTENVEKIHRAVARASIKTGTPIMAHSMPAVGTGPRQVEIFREEGVDLSRVQIAHCGDTDDVAYIEGLIEQGVYVGLDRYGLEMFLSMDKRNETAAELLRRGHAERLMISQDFCASIDWFPMEFAEVAENSGMIRNWSMTLVFDEVVPALRDQGVLDDAVFQTIFVENPKRWLTA